ncbi:MAG: DNA-directed RNA polymerase subunit beta', partial [Chthoniobacter sp.]|nr:DNA-directed RNA polymerase subunit beta' [Chthoniobacter sp.]
MLLNRAPTLHRLGIQAFQPVLVEGKAIRLHPLVCTAFNADFDGDQMAVHVPLSPMAQIEARVLMMSTQNILNPANGRPNVVPSQDIVLGGYYLTKKRQNRKGQGMVFGTLNEVVAAHEAKVVDTHAIIQLRYTGTVVDAEAWHKKDPKKHSEQEIFECPSHEVKRELITTTVGRVIFNRAMPEGLPFINALLKKEGLLSLVNRAYKLNGPELTIKLLDAMKDVGFLWAMKAGVSVGIDDIVVPLTKGKLIKEANEEVRGIEHEYYHEGKLDAATRYNRILEVWGRTSEQVATDMMKELEKRNETGEFLNSIYIMADSGARGSKTQIRQVAGMRGLMAKPSGDIIETPITSNFKEGLSVLQYFTSTHGARKGLADTALKTADSGYLTRKLVDVAQDVIINEDDCGTLDGIEVKAIVNSDGTIRSRLRDRIMGRVVLDDVVDPYSKQVIVPAGTLLTEELAFHIETSGIVGVKIRSVLTCEARRGVCAKCYGLNLSSGRLVDLGEAVGVIAAQSIGEPGTQLTMRTFHVGGTASRVADASRLEAKNAGIVRFINLATVRSKAGDLVAMNRNGAIAIVDAKGREKERYAIVYGAKLKIEDGAKVELGATLGEWDPYTFSVVTEIGGTIQFKDLAEGVTLNEEVDEVTGLSRLVVTDSSDEKRQPALLIKSAKGNKRYLMPSRAHLMVADGDEVFPGDVLAKIPREGTRTKDITGGLPRVVELFEARKPRETAIIAEIDGVVRFGEVSKGQRKIYITADSGEEKEYSVPRGIFVNVQEGERLSAGEPLMDGPLNPHDILAVLGEKALQAYLVNEIQEVYRLQGVAISDKHIETIVRQMLRWVK